MRVASSWQGQPPAASRGYRRCLEALPGEPGGLRRRRRRRRREAPAGGGAGPGRAGGAAGAGEGPGGGGGCRGGERGGAGPGGCQSPGRLPEPPPADDKRQGGKAALCSSPPPTSDPRPLVARSRLCRSGPLSSLQGVYILTKRSRAPAGLWLPASPAPFCPVAPRSCTAVLHRSVVQGRSCWGFRGGQGGREEPPHPREKEFSSRSSQAGAVPAAVPGLQG